MTKPHDQEHRLLIATATAVRWLLMRHGDCTEPAGAKLVAELERALAPFEQVPIGQFGIVERIERP
jgi:hypothetical protein